MVNGKTSVILELLGGVSRDFKPVEKISYRLGSMVFSVCAALRQHAQEASSKAQNTVLGKFG
ncbi:hypothetical protein D5R40_05695 [Okeania hirsuta]|uniref:Uncharacterized protein n=1 Tax=Okeania hirsuta TaxID=1458930 RepID=A0A3N6R3Y5_9CYAN|nr:hypothetical protein D4Z78_02310 [Okeania hirsuta]RQH51457.1 hypothetical protein D5R40_05695 [Okeania hirsuta]